MIEPKIRENYIELITKLYPSSAVREPLCTFINSYDGSNEEQFHALVFTLIGLLSEIEDLKIIKEGFDQVSESSENATSDIDSILQQFKDIQEGKTVQLPVSGVGIGK